MSSTGAMPMDGSMETRTSYIRKIISKLKLIQRTYKLPTATEEALFHEAITHVLNAVIPTPTQGEGTIRPDFNPSPKSMDRKQCLKNILDQLRWMERKRFYDPPADNEIQHYLLIKKYIRSILAFQLALRAQRSNIQVFGFGCISLFATFCYVEDLMEFNQQFADQTECLLEMNTEDAVTSIKPLLGTKNVDKMVHNIGGSIERNYMFCHHKFKLALVDLRSSEFAFCPPLEDEERCYVQVLNAIPSFLIETEDETNVYSEELLNLYLGMIHRETLHIERNFAKIKGWILKHLSLTDWWEVVADQRDEIYYDEYDDKEYYDENALALFRKELSDKCEVSNENMIDYISQVDHCITVALTIEAFIYSCITVRPPYHEFKLFRSWKKSAWGLLFALNVLKYEHLQNHHASRKEERVHHESGRYENVIILKKIIDDLRRIGDCNSAVLDEEEMALVHKIWGSVASSTHFFVGAIAYEQRRHLVEQYKMSGVSIIKLPTTEAGEVVDSTILERKQEDLELDIIKFARDLKAYRRGLTENKVEKLARDQ